MGPFGDGAAYERVVESSCLSVLRGSRSAFATAACQWGWGSDTREEPSVDDKPDVLADRESKGVSRRNFIKGVIAGGVATSSAAYLFRSSSVFGQQSPGMGERLITLNVNGQQRRVDVMKQETLAWTLRYKLGLTGTKLGW